MGCWGKLYYKIPSYGLQYKEERGYLLVLNIFSIPSIKTEGLLLACELLGSEANAGVPSM